MQKAYERVFKECTTIQCLKDGPPCIENSFLVRVTRHMRYQYLQIDISKTPKYAKFFCVEKKPIIRQVGKKRQVKANLFSPLL